MPIGATIVAATVSTGATIYSANKGAKAQTTAANQANDLQKGIFDQTRSDLSPYNTAGQSALTTLMGGFTGGEEGGVPGWQQYVDQHPELVNGPNGYNANKEAWAAAGIPDLQSYAMWHAKGPGADLGYTMPKDQTAGNYWLNGQGSGAGSLTSPIVVNDSVNYNHLLQPMKFDQQTLESLPGYKFALSQGLKSVQNSAAARGLGASGAALKGAAAYATGLADNTYLNQFNTELAQRNQLLTQGMSRDQQQYNNASSNRSSALGALSGIATLGQNAAAQTGTIGATTGQAIGNNITGAGNAQAAGAIAGGNAVGGGATSIANAYYTNNLLNRLVPAQTSATPSFYPSSNFDPTSLY